MQDLKSGLNGILANFDEVLQEIPEAKTEMLKEIGQGLRDEVDESLSSSAKVYTGKVTRWQNYHVGSGLGYAAIRPDKGKSTDGYAYGHITNSIESGHKQTKGRYVPSSGKSISSNNRVNGLHFYKTAKQSTHQTAYKAAEKCAKRLTDKLEGK